MRTLASSRGHHIAYRVEGSGPALLLLCGWSQWSDQWWDCGYGEALARQHRVIAIDRLGHGESDKPHDPREYEEHLLVADVVAVLDAERVEQTIVWGFSLGAKNAASLAVLAGERVDALVYGSGWSLVEPPAAADDDPTMIGLTEAALTETWDDFGFRDPGAVADALARNDLAALSATVRGGGRWWPRADQITVPSLWYAGEAEGGLSDADLRYAAEHGIETHVLPDAGHFDAFARSAEVLAFVEPFLATRRASAHS